VTVHRAGVGEAQRLGERAHVTGRGQAAHVGRNGHAVVVEDHAHGRTQMARVIQGLVGHARGRTAVADHRHHLAILAGAPCGLGHTQGRRDRGARVPGSEDVVGTLAAAQEAAGPIRLLDATQRFEPAGQGLVAVALMAHVPHHAVVRGVEDVVERHGELHGAEASGEMAPDLGSEVDQRRAQLRGHERQYRCIEPPQVRRLADCREQSHSPLAPRSGTSEELRSK